MSGVVSAWFSVGLVLALLAAMPWALRWLQKRAQRPFGLAQEGMRIVSAVGVGPQQRVVTVEVGPPQARMWLTLGVTAQSITCLHTAAAPQASAAVTLTREDGV